VTVRLPLRVRGRDARGFAFEEDTSSENVCRGGAAFRTRFDVAVGSNLQIRIPLQPSYSRRIDADFETLGRVVHVRECENDGDKVVGVQFVGRRLRMFRSENIA
jgi:hypothetical protein